MPSPANFIAQAKGDWSVDRRTDRRGGRSFRSCGGTGPVGAVPMARLPSGAVHTSQPATETRGKERRRVGGITSTPLRSATPAGSWSPSQAILRDGGQRNVSRQMEEPLPALRQWPRCRISGRTRADPIQIGAPGEKNCQIEQDDPS